eukprot:16452375-Heterocapsa_arctica.AAC.2
MRQQGAVRTERDAGCEVGEAGCQHWRQHAQHDALDHVRHSSITAQQVRNEHALNQPHKLVLRTAYTDGPRRTAPCRRRSHPPTPATPAPIGVASPPAKWQWPRSGPLRRCRCSCPGAAGDGTEGQAAPGSRPRRPRGYATSCGAPEQQVDATRTNTRQPGSPDPPASPAWNGCPSTDQGPRAAYPLVVGYCRGVRP